MKGKLILTVEQAEADRKKWEEVRNTGIGGSDVAVIMGLNPWKSAYALYMEKSGQVEPDDLSENEYVYWGTVLEPNVANRFAELTGKKVRKCGTLQDDDYPYMLANVDRLVVGENAGLECKTASTYKKEEWDGENVPDAYYCQCQWYMMVTGFDTWYIACLIGGNHFEHKAIPRNEKFISEMRTAVIEFWENMQKGIAPEIDGSESTTEALRKQYGDVDNKNTVMLPSTCNALITRYDELKATKKVLELQIEEVSNSLKAMLGENQVGLFNDRQVVWKTTAGRTTIDSKALKKEMPDVYAKYAKVGKPSRRFDVK